MRGKIILYIATSLDGFIAREDGNIDWLTQYNNSGEDYGFNEMYARVENVFVGGTTHRQIEDAHKGKKLYVFSRKSEKKADNMQFVSGNVKEILDGMDIEGDAWLVGGANLVKQFLDAGLVDEYIITIVPVMLGKGIPLFLGTNNATKLKMLDVKRYDSGMVQLHYKKLA